MRIPHLVPFVLATVLAPLAAQTDCQHTKAVEIPASAQMGPSRVCNVGIDVEIGGFKISDRPNNCPLFVTLTPTHHEAVPTPDRTYAKEYATTPELLLTLSCIGHWFLFLKVDTTCDITGTANMSQLPLMHTRGCISGSAVAPGID